MKVSRNRAAMAAEALKSLFGEVIFLRSGTWSSTFVTRKGRQFKHKACLSAPVLPQALFGGERAPVLPAQKKDHKAHVVLVEPRPERDRELLGLAVPEWDRPLDGAVDALSVPRVERVDARLALALAGLVGDFQLPCIAVRLERRGDPVVAVAIPAGGDVDHLGRLGV